MTRYLYSVEEIDALLTARMGELAHLLLPDGEKRGHEWVARNPGRADKRRGSLSVNLSTGVWKDFATGQGSKHMPGLGLVANFATGGEFLAAIGWAKKWLGIDDGGASLAKARDVEESAKRAREKRDADEARTRTFKRELAFKLFLEARPLTGEDPASLYLIGRGLKLEHWPRALRFHPRLSHPNHGGEFPALVACMSLEGAPNGFGGIHRIYLSPPVYGGSGSREARDVGGQWVKAWGGEDAKLALGYVAGATVRISHGASGKRLREAPAGDGVLITEGVEDALALSLALPDARICAAYSLAAIGQAKFPPQVGLVTVVADNDAADSAAVEQLERAAAALAERHEQVAIAHMPAAYKDVNDTLIGKRRAP